MNHSYESKLSPCVTGGNISLNEIHIYLNSKRHIYQASEVWTTLRFEIGLIGGIWARGIDMMSAIADYRRSAKILLIYFS